MTHTIAARACYRVSFFQSRLDIHPQHIEFPDFASVAQYIGNRAQQRDQRDGLAICGAEFHDGTTRANANVALVHVVAIDLDDVEETVAADVLDRLDEAGIEYFWHTTFSHAPDSGTFHYRVLIPLDRATTPAEFRQLLPRLWDWLAVAADADPCCKDPARMFYLPAAPTWRDGLPAHGYVTGGPLCVQSMLSRPLPPGASATLSSDDVLPEIHRAEITDGTRARWRAKVTALVSEILCRPYPGSIYDLKNGKAYGLAQVVPHILSLDELREPVVEALRQRNPGATEADLAVLNRAIEQVDRAITDGMSHPWWPERQRWPLTDTGNAERMVKRHGHEIRFVPMWRRFAAYDRDNGCWSHVRGRETVLDMTKAMARSIPDEVQDLADEQTAVCAALQNGGAPDQRQDDLKRREEELTEVLKHTRSFAKYSESARGRNAVLAMLQGERSLLTAHEEFDKDPWLLNVLNGTIDLRRGTVLPHDPQKLITKQGNVRFDGGATAPIFDRFLREICCNDDELVDYLLRCLGYTLTGDVREHCLFLTYGGGRNGKSTLLNLMHTLLADYAVVLAPHLLLQSKHEQHPTAKADLFRARMCSTREIEEGRMLAEAEVKQLTGGDPVRARHMHEDFWSFDPTHKIWMSANALPRVRGTDDAIWARIRAIPFDACFIEREDRDLAHKLTAELPGVLNRLLQGCLAWQRHGLRPPSRVLEATSTYRRSQDPLSAFLEDCFDVDPGIGAAGPESLARSALSPYFVPRPAVWARYEQWSAAEGSRVFNSGRSLYDALRRQFSEHRSNGNFFRGLRLRTG